MQQEADISILDFPDCVRLRKEMYLSDMTHAVFEIIDNAVDEHLAGRCDTIQVVIDQANKVSILDNGSGIPVEKHTDPRYAHLSKAEVAFTVLHAGGKFGVAGSGSYESATGGLHGVGASCTNATSDWMALTVYKNQKIYQATFSKGLITSHLTEIGTYEESFSGTQVDFILDTEIWGDELLNYKKISTRLKQLAYLNPGLMLTFKCDVANHESDEQFYFEQGVRSYVEELIQAQSPLTEVLYGASTLQAIDVQIALAYTEAHSSHLYSFCNNIPTENGGDHLIGFNHGIAKAINDYAQEKKFIKDDQKFDISDCLEGVTGIVSIVAKNAAFDGQGKTKIKMPYVRPLIRNYVSTTLFNFLDHHPDEASKIIERVLLSQKARLAAIKAREHVRKQKGVPVGNAKGLAQCIEKDPSLCEIYIVEGDSAGGTVKNARDRQTQAVLPLFGKILNTEKSDTHLVEDNSKLEELNKALRCGTGETFNIDDLRYHMIIISSDADMDGLHIQVLYLTYFYRYMRPIIEKGYLYMAMPPLFKIVFGASKNKQVRYAYSDAERDEICQELSNSNEDVHEIKRFKGLGEMNPDQLWETTMNPETRTLIQITIEDAEAAEEALMVCMGKAVPPRRAFIEENALYAQLDV